VANIPEGPASNPYGAPLARVTDAPSAEAHGLLDQGRAVPAKRGLAWYGDAWRLFRVSPGAWIGLWVLFVVLVTVVTIIPLLGAIATFLLTPIFLGGAMLAARSAERTRMVPVGQLFAAFGTHAGPLALIGLLNLVAWFVVFMVVGLGAAMVLPSFLIPGIAGAPQNASSNYLMAMLPFIGIGFLTACIYVPITYATWMAAALVALHDIPAIDALRLGFGGIFRNVLPLLVCWLAGAVLAVLASVPLFLGWLVLGPVGLCVLYAQYRDVFTTTP
jgi:hypothetical protein